MKYFDNFVYLKHLQSMSKIVQQIQTRFKFFQILWLIQILFAPVFIILTEFMNADNYKRVEQIANGVDSAFTLNITLLLIFGVVFLVYLPIGIAGTVSYTMLTHGIFNYLKKYKESKVDPTWAVWSIFIPVASGILVALNFNKAFESLNLRSSTAKHNLYYSIFSIFIVSILSFVNMFYVIFQSINNYQNPIIPQPFINSTFYISIISIFISLGVIYFLWKTLKETVVAIGTENSNQVI
jgi:hypothetical protein